MPHAECRVSHAAFVAMPECRLLSFGWRPIAVLEVARSHQSQLYFSSDDDRLNQRAFV